MTVKKFMQVSLGVLAVSFSTAFLPSDQFKGFQHLAVAFSATESSANYISSLPPEQRGTWGSIRKVGGKC